MTSETDNGQLPKDWEEISIGAITTLVYRYPTYYGITYVEEGVPEIRGELLLDNGEIESDRSKFRFVTEDTADKFPKVRLEPGDIVMSVRGTMGKIGIVRQPLRGAVITANLIRLSPQRAVILPDFFRLALLTPEFIHALNGASPQTTIKTITAPALKDLTLTIPRAISEQQKIAAVLGLVQRAIEQQERLIALTTELKKALLHKLFTEGLRGEPQKQTEIGPVPQSWEVVPLGDVAAIERGKFSHRPRNHPRFYGGSTPFVQTGDVSNCDGKIRTFSQTLNEEGVAISKIFPAGTILITIAANIGFSGILQFDSACPDSLIGLTPNHRISAEFLQYYLSTQQPAMDRLAPRGTQKNINIQFLKPWPIRLPPTEEQDQIVESLSAVDAKLRSTGRKRRTLDDLFRTLLHQLMTAQIRVHDLNIPPLEPEVL